MLNDETVKKFKASLRGALIQPNDEGYDIARKVYNGMIDRRPRLIAQCADVADVIAAVNFGRQNSMLVAIRGGGHNAGGLGVCDDCLVIDLSLIKYTRIDPVARTVRVGGGCAWGEVDHATHAFGLAVPSGFISTTGVGGLTLGGGLGHLRADSASPSIICFLWTWYWPMADMLRPAQMKTLIFSGRYAAVGATMAWLSLSCLDCTPLVRFTPDRCFGGWSRPPR